MTSKVSKNLSLQQKQKYLKIAQKAVKLGQKNLMSYYGKVRHIQLKSKSNFVSEADITTEKIIRHALKKLSPEVDFLGEESNHLEQDGKISNTIGNSKWILDPLDGTTNFLNGFPLFCISLGLEYNGEIVVALIYVPLLKQTFTAIRGSGAFLNGERLKVRIPEKTSHSFLVTGFVNQSKSVLTKQLKIFNKLVWDVDAIRRSGSAAFDLACVASGVFHAYWEENVKPWDVAAGLLLVEEAGGIVREYSGQKSNQYSRQFIAGSPVIVNKIIQYTKPHQKFLAT